MIRLKIDKEKCTKCFACEYYLPKLLLRAINGELLISPTNANQKDIEIQSAMSICPTKAISIENESLNLRDFC